MLVELYGQLGYGTWGEGVVEGSGGDGERLSLGRHNFLLIEGVMSVDIGMAEGGGCGGLDPGVADDDFGFAGIANGRIHHGQDDFFVVERGRTL